MSEDKKGSIIILRIFIVFCMLILFVMATNPSYIGTGCHFNTGNNSITCKGDFQGLTEEPNVPIYLKPGDLALLVMVKLRKEGRCPLDQCPYLTYEEFEKEVKELLSKE